MKNIQYLSPTSISLFYESPTEFYLNYLSDNRPPRFPQTKPMSVGSSFDAHAKSYLYEKLFGKAQDPRFEFKTLFEAQVEEHNRDWALPAGKHAFDIYQKSGALSDLMLDLSKAIGKPSFEFEVRGVVNGHREGVTMDVGNVTFLGKPDCFYINKMGAHVILDWKVNGFCSNSTVSPMQGYVRIRSVDGKNKGSHKSAQVMSHKGVMINVAGVLETYNEDWARQLSIYAWLCGEDIGSDFIAAIDQLACSPNTPNTPSIRIAEHRLRVSKDYQWNVFAQAQKIWQICHAEPCHFFQDVSLEESQLRCRALDGQAEALKGDGTTDDLWFATVTRQ